MSISGAVRDIRTLNALVTGAEDEARRLGDELPGAEHLLLAALGLPEGSARRALARAGADPVALRDAIRRGHAGALEALGIDPGGLPADDVAAPAGPRRRPVRMSANARQVFRRVSELARSGPRGRLAGAHVVLAASELEHGTAARALRGLGVERSALAAAARAELGLRAVS